mmetsp:Transcript_26581/g.61047  ORF Transcript_26581/g.61047 Transcript_26581/m.61047 type:complete len:217 (-) Transcript_26581:3501-4151(-)
MAPVARPAWLCEEELAEEAELSCFFKVFRASFITCLSFSSLAVSWRSDPLNVCSRLLARMPQASCNVNRIILLKLYRSRYETACSNFNTCSSVAADITAAVDRMCGKIFLMTCFRCSALLVRNALVTSIHKPAETKIAMPPHNKPLTKIVRTEESQVEVSESAVWKRKKTPNKYTVKKNAMDPASSLFAALVLNGTTLICSERPASIVKALTIICL